jgi:anaerobic sulfite reductase subunit A
MAGQREMRATAGDRMRYKMLHKFRDYDARFHEGHMCVGCGRCTHRCPELISISATVNKMSAAVEEIRAQLGK